MASVGGSGELYLYSRLREIFREKVRSGEWPAEQPIPSERDLAGRYGVSRMTVRQAILELVDEGLFYREQGRGTFVGRLPIGDQPRLAGFSEEMRARQPATRLLEAGIPIRVLETDQPTIGVDTEEDLRAVEALLSSRAR